mmetsp:Transcript_56100/g.121351  ORF Transcript_56100/g.121351 Transcript_56100/m.121351 type:complete len:149 (-) Transcript_56100:177-623(-)
MAHRSRQAPGGNSTICLGGDGPTAAPQSANAFASSANQNGGNFLTGRPTTGLNAPPGGFSTISLGSEAGRAPATSSRTPARPADQCGLAAGQRTACRGEQAAGGYGSVASSSIFNSGLSPAAGSKFINERPGSGVHIPPGGRSTIQIG